VYNLLIYVSILEKATDSNAHCLKADPPINFYWVLAALGQTSRRCRIPSDASELPRGARSDPVSLLGRNHFIGNKYLAFISKGVKVIYQLGVATTGAARFFSEGTPAPCC
jgi:hypothetical protein